MHRLLSLLVLCLPVVAAGQTRTFQNPLLIPTAGDTASLITGDWNKDGKQDLAYIDNSSSPSLHVLLGVGNGSFTVGQTLALPAYSCSYIGVSHACFLMQADINGDSKPDFVFVSTPSDEAGSITVLPGNGDGTFGTAIVTTFSANDSDPPFFLIPAIADFNGDGKLDIVVPDYYGPTRFFTGDGAGHFTQVYASNTIYNTEVFPGDFNKDGNVDFLVLYAPEIGEYSAQIFYGSGTTSFTAGTSISVPGQGMYADVNGDGIPDLVGSAGANVWVMLGTSSGGFAASQQLKSTVVSGDSLVAVADVNGDGVADLLFSTATGIKILLGQGNLAFAAPDLATTGSIAQPQVVEGDFNGDGIKDIAAGTPGGIVMLLGNATESLNTTNIFSLASAANGIFAADFNGDGRADLLVLGPSGAIQTYLGTATGTVSAGPAQTLAATPPTAGVVADFDKDGKLDVAFGGGTLSLLYGNGDGSFTPLTATASTNTIVVADLNNDGYPDLVTLLGPFSDVSFNTYYTLSGILSSAKRTFTQVNTTLPTTIFSPILIGSADLNHDGFADAVFFDENLGGFDIWLGNGDGSFRVGQSIALSQTTLSYDTVSTNTQRYLLDVDGDGNPDLVLFGTGSNLLIFYGDGGGGFSAPQTVAFTHTFGSFTIADINKDGKPDLVAWNGSLIAVLLNQGGRSFSSEQHFVGGSAINQLFAVDLNGDGYPDLIADYASFAEQPGSLATIMLNQAIQATSSGNPVQETVTLTPQTVAYNQGFTVNAVIASAIPAQTATPTGTVQFSVDNQSLGTVTLKNGTASITVPGSTTSTLSTGAQSVSAVYSGDAVFAATTSNANINVLEPVYTTVATLTATPGTIQAGQFVQLNAAVKAPVNVAYGIVTFYDGTNILGQTAVSVTGLASLQTNQLAIGSNSITAVYNGVTIPPDLYGVPVAVFQASTSAPVVITETALATSTVLNTSSTSITAGTVLTLTAQVTSTSAPFGGITFYDGSTALGTMALSNTGIAALSTVSLASGSHNFSAVYTANDPFAGSTSANVQVSVRVAEGSRPSPSVLFPSVNASPQGAGMQLAVMVSASTGHPTGTVTLLRDDQVVVTAPVSADGIASFLLTESGASAHRLYASYSGNATFAPASSPLFLSTDYTTSSDFSLQPAAALSLSGTTTIGISGIGNWASTVQLSCLGGVPQGYACEFSPAAVSGSGQTALRLVPVTQASLQFAGLLGAAMLIPFLRRRRRSIMPIFLLALLTAIAGCGTDARSSKTQSTILTVQATSGGVVHSVQLLVQQ